MNWGLVIRKYLFILTIEMLFFLAKNPVFHVCTKYIDVRYQFVQEIISEGRILLQKIETIKNPRDLLIKAVTTIKFNHCLDLINIANV